MTNDGSSEVDIIRDENKEQVTLPSRRIVIKIAGAALGAYSAPRIASAGCPTPRSLSPGGPIDLPFSQSENRAGTAEVSGDITSAYDINASWDLNIDEAGAVTLTNLNVQGTNSGVGIDMGPFSLVQTPGSAQGTYAGIDINMPVNMEYSDCGNANVPVQATFRGTYSDPAPQFAVCLVLDLTGPLSPCKPNFSIVEIASISVVFSHRS